MLLQQVEGNSDGLLGDGDPLPLQRLDYGAGSVLVVCDHAGNRIPGKLGRLGLKARHLRGHIAWDIGAGGVARCLGELFGTTVIAGSYSRLVVDLNRAAHDPSAVPGISDGVLVPGNLGLDDRARALRVAAIHEPYHAGVAAALREKAAVSESPVMVAIHSFTPRLSGIWRPWHVGVLWDKDPRLALPLLAALRAGRDVVVGDNEPYSGRHTADYTIDRHAEAAGIAYAAVEIRQDLLQSEDGQRAWAKRLYSALCSSLDGAPLSEPIHAMRLRRGA